SLKRDAGRDRKLGWIITRANHACYLAAILLNRRYHRIGIQIACVGTEKPREEKCSAIIVLRLIRNTDVPQLTANFHGVLNVFSKRSTREVIYFPRFVVVKAITDLRTATRKSRSYAYRR